MGYSMVNGPKNKKNPKKALYDGPSVNPRPLYNSKMAKASI